MSKPETESIQFLQKQISAFIASVADLMPPPARTPATEPTISATAATGRAVGVLLKEREYQRATGKHDDHVPAEWLAIIQKYHDAAAHHWFHGEEVRLHAAIRNLAGVALAAVENLAIELRHE